MILLIGFSGGIAVIWHFQEAKHEARLAYRRDGGGPLRPIFLRDPRDTKPCPKTSNEALSLDKAMLDAERSAAALGPNNPVHNYVVSFFAWHWSLGRTRCPPSDEIVLQLAPFLDRIGWPRGNTELNDLRLIERLPPSEVRARGLAHIGFLDWIPPSNLQGEDSRPYARQLLADQGRFALPWGKRALLEINGSTRLGTSAAYLAVATMPDVALPKVRHTMLEKLRTSRERPVQAYQDGGEITVISSDDANRLIELGYALARGGASAEFYSQPVIQMLDEKIARAAPPFGLLAAKPTEFCRIARHIGGRAAEAAEDKPFCAPGFKGGDGAPRSF